MAFWHALLRRIAPERTALRRTRLLAEILADERAGAVAGASAFARPLTPLPDVPVRQPAVLARGTAGPLPVLRPLQPATAEYAVSAPEFDEEVQTGSRLASAADPVEEGTCTEFTVVEEQVLSDPDFTEPDLVIPPYLAALAAERERG